MWDGADRRKFPRAEYPCLITVRKNVPEPEAILTHTENISVDGVRAIIGKKIEIMTEVDLELDLKDASAAVTLRGRINRIKEIVPSWKDRPGRYEIGVQFTNIKDEDRRRIQNVINHLLEKNR